jgi:photosystem II stability/assembly factor-like uncharacterized protein
LPSQVANKNLYAISNQGSNLFIAGDGCLLKSTNNGDQWTLMYLNTDYYFFDVKFTDAQNGYAVGWTKGVNALNKIATLFKTVDGGVNWILFFSSTRPSSASTRFAEGEMRNGAIDFLDESRLIWGCGTTQFYSATGGRGNHCTVTPVQTYAVSIPNINKSFIGSSGLLESLRGGVSFGISGYQSSDYYDFDLVTPNDLYSVTGFSANEIMKIKVNQTNTSKYKTITGTTSNDRFFGIDFLDLDYGFVVGKFGKVAYTLNGGDSFIHVTPFTSEQLNDLFFYSKNAAIVIGNNGTLLRMNSSLTTNATITNVKTTYNETDINWSTISTGTSNDLYEVEVKSGVTYIAGDGLILKSDNQGVSFSIIYSNSDYQFRDISFVDASLGWVIGYNILQKRIEVLKTTNGGTNWTVQTTMPGSSAGVITGLVIEALNSSYVIATYADALNSAKKVTTDGGSNWSNVGGNFEVAPISDFIFLGNEYSSDGHQGFGTKRTGGGTYLATNIDNGACNNVAGCISITNPEWIKEYGMNAISSAENQLAIARDMDWVIIPRVERGYIERSKIANPKLASDWGCFPTYTPVHYYGVKMINANEIWLAGAKGTVITTRSAHGGIISETSEPNPQKEWFGHNTGTLNDLFDIESIDNSKMICVGKNGTIIITNNAQSNVFLAGNKTLIQDPLETISIFPNPTNGLFNVTISDKLIGSKMEIFNMDGRIINHTMIDKNTVAIDLTNCINGMYIIRISSLNETISHKIIKN